MTAWLWHHWHSLRSTLGRLARAPVASLFSAAVIGLAVALPAGLYLTLANLQHFAGGSQSDPRLSVFLALDAQAADVSRVDTSLKRHPGVRAFRYVPRDAALAELKSASGMADVVDSLGHNPLPDAYVVESRDISPAALEKLRDEIRGWPKVAHVQLDTVWARRLEAGLRIARLAVWMLGALFAFALMAITFNTIRLQILTRREEIEVARLIGATDGFVRRPFLYFGALQGLAGGAAAWGIVTVAVYLMNDALSQLAPLYGVPVQLRPLLPSETLALLCAAAALGWLGSWLSVRQHLKSI